MAEKYRIKLKEIEADEEVRIVELSINSVKIMVIFNLREYEDKVILDELHIDADYHGVYKVFPFKTIAKEFANFYRVSKITIQGGVRTTGKRKGTKPTPIRFDFNDD